MRAFEYKQKRLILFTIIAVLAGLIIIGTVNRNSPYEEIENLFPAFSISELKSLQINELAFVEDSQGIRLKEFTDIPLNSDRLDLLFDAFRKARIVRSYKIGEAGSDEYEAVFDNAYSLSIEFAAYSVEYLIGSYNNGQQYIQAGQQIMVLDTIINPFLKDTASYWYDYKVMDRSIQQASAIGLFFTGDFFDEDFQLTRNSSDEKGDVWQWNNQDVPSVLIERFFSRLHGLEGSELAVSPSNMVQTGTILISLSNGRDYVLSLHNKVDSDSGSSLGDNSIWISSDRTIFYRLNAAALSAIPENALSLLQPGE